MHIQYMFVNMAQNADSKDQTFADIKQRFRNADGNIEVRRDELLTLGILKDYGIGDHENLSVNHEGPIVARGNKDIDPVKYYLVRVDSNQWMSLKYLYNLSNSGDKWYCTGVGDINVSGVPLDDDFGDGLSVSENTISQIQEGYVREAVDIFNNGIDDLWGAAYDGNKVYMEVQDPWRGLNQVADHLGIDDNMWEHEIRPAIADSMPPNPRILDTDLITEFAVEVEFENE